MTPRSSHFLSLWKLASSIIPSCLRLQLRLINSLLQSEANLSKRNWPLTCSFLVFWPLFHLAASKSQSSWKHYVHFLLVHWTSLLPTPASLPVSLRLPRPPRLHSQRMPITSWWSGFSSTPLGIHLSTTCEPRPDGNSPLLVFHCSEWFFSFGGFCFSSHIRLLFKGLALLLFSSSFNSMTLTMWPMPKIYAKDSFF